jgi:hypothetical protein
MLTVYLLSKDSTPAARATITNALRRLETGRGQTMRPGSKVVKTTRQCLLLPRHPALTRRFVRLHAQHRLRNGHSLHFTASGGDSRPRPKGTPNFGLDRPVVRAVPGAMVSVGRAVSGGHGNLQGAGAPGPRPITAIRSPTPLCPSYAPRLGLPNVRFLPFTPRERLHESFAAAESSWCRSRPGWRATSCRASSTGSWLPGGPTWRRWRRLPRWPRPPAATTAGWSSRRANRVTSPTAS